MQHNKYVKNQDVKMYSATKYFPELDFLGTHNKPHGVRGLCKHYHIRFYTKLGHVTCAIRLITFFCTFSTSIMYQPWDTGFP